MNNQEVKSVKDLAKNMNFGFLGKTREQMLLEKKQSDEMQIRIKREMEERELSRLDASKIDDAKSNLGQSFISQSNLDNS